MIATEKQRRRHPSVYSLLPFCASFLLCLQPAGNCRDAVCLCLSFPPPRRRRRNAAVSRSDPEAILQPFIVCSPCRGFPPLTSSHPSPAVLPALAGCAFLRPPNFVLQAVGALQFSPEFQGRAVCAAAPRSLRCCLSSKKIPPLSHCSQRGAADHFGFRRSRLCAAMQ